MNNLQMIRRGQEIDPLDGIPISGVIATNQNTGIPRSVSSMVDWVRNGRNLDV